MKKTPLYDEHLKLGGKMVSFSGWQLPVQYSTLLLEHDAVRKAAGLFDVSHMGEVTVEGSRAEAFVNQLITNDVSKIEVGQALYTVMCVESGGIVDDLVVYRRAQDRYLLVINAGNIAKDFEHIEMVADHFGRDGLDILNKSDSYCQIALQGPKAEKILQKICPMVELEKIGFYRFQETEIMKGISGIISRTGYTGEDGFELYVDSKEGPLLWTSLLEAGKSDGLLPCGLGCRDTLRLEMKFPLYGNEIDLSTNPLEAGLGWVCKFKKERFLGKDALLKIKEDGLKRKLVGFEMLGKMIPRQGYLIFDNNKNEIGKVTSGTRSPTLGKGIGIGYVTMDNADMGSEVLIQIRNNLETAKVVKTPFYTREK